LIAGSLFFIQASAGSPGVNPILAVLVSLIACGLLFVAGSKGVEAMARKPFQNPDNLLTKTGEARTTVYKEGSVYINGENWSARSAKSIPSGTRIRVLKRDGLVLVVEALPPEG
jgi:membrane-bound serine protease (ClpP class)